MYKIFNKLISLKYRGIWGKGMIRKSLTKLGICFAFSLTLWANSSKVAIGEAVPILPGIQPNCYDIIEPKEESTDYKKPGKMTAGNLSDIVQETIKKHPGIAADREALSASDDVIDQAVGGYLPSVDLRASIGRDNIVRSFNTNQLNPLESKGSISSTRSDPTLSLRQILFDGMGNSSRIDRAHSQRHQALGTLGVTTDTAIIDAATATVDMRRLQRLLEIVNKNIHFHKVMRDKVAQIVQAGVASISDLNQLEARLQDTYIAKSNIESDLEVARAKFIEVVGKEPPNKIKRIHLPAHLSALSLEMAVRMAMDYNNAIKVAKSSAEVADANYREAAAKMVPTVTFEFEAERDRNMSGTTGFQNRMTTMIVARQNLFSGGTDMAKTRETAKRKSEANARVVLARRQIERTIHGSWGEARNARKKSAHLTKLVHEKRRIRDIYIIEFDIGKRSIIDILDAANDVFLSEATRTTADATADINTIILSVGTGQFQRQLNSMSDAETEVEHPKATNCAHDTDSDLHLTPYSPVAESKPLVAENTYKVKKVAQKRKSMFERRKEERLNGLPDKARA
jgi:adhesin transport system outer membrane protein